MILTWIRQHLWLTAYLVVAIIAGWGFPFPQFAGCCCGVVACPVDCPGIGFPTTLQCVVTGGAPVTPAPPIVMTLVWDNVKWVSTTTFTNSGPSGPFYVNFHGCGLSWIDVTVPGLNCDSPQAFRAVGRPFTCAPINLNFSANCGTTGHCICGTGVVFFNITEV